ncbi:hypothetical protein QFC22_004562 [Naganishia vaughanmartiniae]|uniref:Uncharacterized protein n=1 Tax=Naganishia vaughanmartiniae TaxID=1424756 RepID=A0ACC2WYN3_9TREE|nr:hypothetical protein QFC22_004562 [Naganishia vaughanmartiniae]
MKEDTTPQTQGPTTQAPSESQSFAAKLFRRWIGSSRSDSPQETPSTIGSSTSTGSISFHKLEVPESRSPSLESLHVQNLGVTTAGKERQSSRIDSPAVRISRLVSRRQKKRAQTSKDKAYKPGYGLQRKTDGDPIVSHMRSQMREGARKRDEDRERIFATLKAALPGNSKTALAKRKTAQEDDAGLDDFDGRAAADVPDDIVEGLLEEAEVTRKEKSRMHTVVSGKLEGKHLEITGIKPDFAQPKVASLKRGLSRVLFKYVTRCNRDPIRQADLLNLSNDSPTVHFLRDPHSLVYNFPPSIEHIPRRDQFAAHRLPGYITASQDKDLLDLAKQHQLKYYGSTSTLTTALSQIYFLISGFRPVNTSNLTQAFADEVGSPMRGVDTEDRNDFTAGAKLPAMLWLRHMEDGVYAVDNDKRWDVEENVLSDLGRVMEKMVTSDEEEMSRYMVTSPESAVPEEERNQREAYHYSKENSAYDIHKLTGLKESFEKEFYDMSRAAFLKYSMQVRIGDMDGIFVAYHNTARIFGFQYISLAEMDSILHGSPEMGAQAFKLAVTLFETILEQATAIYPNQTLNLVLEASKASEDGHLNIFVTPEIPNEETPIVHFKLKVQNKLDGHRVRGPVDFAGVYKRHGRVSWTVEYELSKNHSKEAAFNLAEKELHSARQKIRRMASLSLPTGKTKEDMEIRDTASPTESPEGASTTTTEGDNDQPIDKSKLEILPVPSRPAVYVKWKEPDGHILKMRALAKQSGRRYTQRLAGVKGRKPVVYRDRV